MTDVEMETVGKADGFTDALLDRRPTMIMDSADSEMI